MPPTSHIMASPNQQNLKKKNAEYSEKFKNGDLKLPPWKKYAVITCMDARIDPAAAFGIDLGDAHVIRNAGACAKDALRSIVISQQLLGTREILVVKHTDCGMLTFTNDDIREVVKKELPPAAAVELATLDFLPFPEVEQAVRDDLAFLKQTTTIREDTVVSGWVYDVKSGAVKPIAPA
ncbi:carbonate dehydratase [Apiospora arundinis]|uniref:Carbonic anhydrase n=1 Tax=Apiospora arundinis TaxID=335852 RepID=A0ABR2HNG3_9PEZI